MPNPNSNPNVLSWDDYFMGVAVLASKRSKHPDSQVGACVVDADKRIVGVGWNGAPTGCKDKDFPWGSIEQELYVCHAAMNAIAMYDVKGSTMYSTVIPCKNCAKIIIQAGIKEVVYKDAVTCYSEGNGHPKEVAVRKLFHALRINERQFKGIELKF